MTETDNEVGGLPRGIVWLTRYLPLERSRRNRIIMVLTIVLTYLSYVTVNTVRRPMTVAVHRTVADPGCVNRTDVLCTHIREQGPESMIFLGTIFLASYAVFLQISGCVADYFNPRYYLSAGCLGGCFFSVCMGLAHSWMIFELDFMSMVLVMISLAQSTAWPILLSCVTYWYTGPKRGLFFGLWNTHAYVGGMIGVYVASAMPESVRGYASILPGILLGITAIFVFFFLVAHPSDLSMDGSSTLVDPDLEDSPSWLSSWRSLDYSDAFRVPGVPQYSVCMFFGRAASYTFTFWLPKLQAAERTLPAAAEMVNVWYVLGGIAGGVLSGVLVDVFQKSSLVCVCFFAAAVPVIGLQAIWLKSASGILNFFLGLVVEGPCILLNTSISADLGNHSLIRRGYRGISTVAAIIESAGASGASLTPYIFYHLMVLGRPEYILYLMMAVEVCAALCLAKMAARDYMQGPPGQQSWASLRQYWTR